MSPGSPNLQLGKLPTVWSTTVPTIPAAFLGSLVKVVEAFTTVLAVALTQGWRPALIGSALALALLVLACWRWISA